MKKIKIQIIKSGVSGKKKRISLKKKSIEKRATSLKYNRDKNLYLSDQWKSLRRKVLAIYGNDCMCCPKTNIKSPHIDHIKPSSKFPNLAYDIMNLQVLCEECNLDKSNIRTTDYRSEDQIRRMEQYINQLSPEIRSRISSKENNHYIENAKLIVKESNKPIKRRKKKRNNKKRSNMSDNYNGPSLQISDQLDVIKRIMK